MGCLKQLHPKKAEKQGRKRERERKRKRMRKRKRKGKGKGKGKGKRKRKREEADELGLMELAQRQAYIPLSCFCIGLP